MQALERELIALRHKLHACAELSEQEIQTAQTVREFLAQQQPEAIVDNIGGHGVAAVFAGEQNGPCLVLRAELDALPQKEQLDVDYRSPSTAAHKCGHDGHMAMLCGVAARFAAQRPAYGKLVLLFQPAEETGKGAALVVENKLFQSLGVTHALALHNVPGFALGQVVLREGCFASASRGLVVELEGATSHAAEPQRGRSPALALARLIQEFSAVPQFFSALDEAAQVTVVYARLGQVAFGTSPASATLMATLRAHNDDVMRRIGEQCTYLTAAAAAAWRLESKAFWTEDFPATVNDAHVLATVRSAAHTLDLDVVDAASPFAWSEDFGHFTHKYAGALFGLGAGLSCPALHHPDYDFPDKLIMTGLAMLENAARHLLSSPANGA